MLKEYAIGVRFRKTEWHTYNVQEHFVIIMSVIAINCFYFSYFYAVIGGWFFETLREKGDFENGSWLFIKSRLSFKIVVGVLRLSTN